MTLPVQKRINGEEKQVGQEKLTQVQFYTRLGYPRLGKKFLDLINMQSQVDKKDSDTNHIKNDINMEYRRILQEK